MAEYEISDKVITRHSGDESQRSITVLKLVGPWLSWQDWRKLVKLNKIIREWCHSEDASIGLIGLWQERTMSRNKLERQLTPGGGGDFNFLILSPFPFLALTFPNNYLYRSLLELSDLERKIVENGSLRVSGGEDDKWLRIDYADFDLHKTNYIPPYYHLKFAVPKGLKIAVSDPAEHFIYINDRFCVNPCGYRKEFYIAVGRATALGLSGLVVYWDNPTVTVLILESFVTALQEQKKGEFVSPLEILLFPSMLHRKYEPELRERLRRVLSSLSRQTVLGKLRNLKYLHLEFLDTKTMAEKFGLRHLGHACPNLQILTLGLKLSTDFKYIRNVKLPDSVYGPYNSIQLNRHANLTDLNEGSPHLIGIFVDLDIPLFLKTNLLPSLKVLIIRDDVLDEEAVGALATNCPALRFLRIYYSDLYHWYATWNALLKRLFVLILDMRDGNKPDTRSLPIGCFPEGCKLRVLTVVGHDRSDFYLWLDDLLGIIDVCLPKLCLLNVTFFTYEMENDLLSEQDERREDNLKYQFNQKSVDLTFITLS